MSAKKYTYIRKTRTIDGKRYEVYGKTEKEAQQKLDALIVELANNGQKLDGSTTVRRWASQWLEIYINPRDATAKSLRMYREKLDTYILPAIGNMKIKDVRDVHLQRILNKSNSSKSNVTKVRIVIRAMFRQARHSRLITFDPAEDLMLPKAPAGKRRSITDYEREHILAVAETHRSGLAVLLMLYCGLRPGEAAALQWSDVDLQRRQLHVFKAIESGNSQVIKAPKTDAGDRFIPIPAPLLARLQTIRHGPFDYVLIQPRGRSRHTESSMRCLWSSFKKALDIHMGAVVKGQTVLQHAYQIHPMLESEQQWAELKMYCLRHTYGTDLQRAGVPINVAKYLMGHTDIAVTGNIYTDTTPDVIDAAEVAMNALHCGKTCGKSENQSSTSA